MPACVPEEQVIMVVINEMGGVRVYGEAAASWISPVGRWINGVVAEFNSEVYWPDVNGSIFVLPAFRGRPDYKIYLIEDGALILKEGYAFLCIKVNGRPQVLNYNSEPADSETAKTL